MVRSRFVALAVCSVVSACRCGVDSNPDGGTGGGSAGGTAAVGGGTGGSGGAVGGGSGGGATGGGGSVGGGTGGGSADAGECVTAASCPGTDTDCRVRTCIGSACGAMDLDAGTAIATQQAGDCQKVVCNGSGATTSLTDDTDIPVDDGVQCTVDTCLNGAPTHPNLDAGTACDAGVCAASGLCVQCLSGTDCPGADTQCRTRTCNLNTCGATFTAAGVDLTAQTVGDCRLAECDGDGGVALAIDNGDVPGDDGNACTSDSCAAGTPVHPPRAVDTGCGTGVCNDAGTCVECNRVAQCTGNNTECRTLTCVAGVCGARFADAGIALSAQDAGDCRQQQCDGDGGTVNALLASDLPPDDGLECTSEICTASGPVHQPVGVDTGCDAGVCDLFGACVQCNSPSQCGANGECFSRTCGLNTCGMTLTSAGAATSAQTANDCHQRQCDGDGGVDNAIDDNDSPVDDGNSCTSDTCSLGSPVHSPKPENSACDAGVCSLAAVCVQCNVPAHCGASTECRLQTCDNNACGVLIVDAGTALVSQTPGDCHEVQCDGDGGTSVLILDSDVPADDGVQCTQEICTNGTPSHPATVAGASCTQGGSFCSGTGVCLTSNFAVVRVGSGAAALSPAATEAFVELHFASGAIMGTIPLPAYSGSVRACTMAGNAIAEGALSRSEDLHYLTVGCYDADAGIASVASSPSVNVPRIVGRIAADQSVDTTTRLTTFSGGNIRAATSRDGNAFWASGSNASPQYVTLGSSGTSTSLVTAPTNTRDIHTIAGQLYCSAASGAFHGVFAIGNGEPTTSGQTTTTLNGDAGVGNPIPYGFAVFDANPAVAGPDLMYIADDRSIASGGGVQKWTFDGSGWNYIGAFSAGLTAGARAVAVMKTGGDYTILATTDESVTRVVMFLDTGLAPGGVIATPLITAPPNTAYRGIAFMAQ